jgi:hypothetical protein
MSTSTFSFADPHPFPKHKCDALGVSPNQLWFNETAKVAALVVKLYGGFALSKTGLYYLYAAEQAGKLKGVVVLAALNAAGQLFVVKIKPIADVVAAIGKFAPHNGPHGPYWWVLPDDLDPHHSYYEPELPLPATNNEGSPK